MLDPSLDDCYAISTEIGIYNGEYVCKLTFKLFNCNNNL